MEIPVSLSTHFSSFFLLLLVCGGMFAAVLGMCFLCFKKWKHLDIRVDRIPGPKMPFYNFNGVLLTFPSFSTIEKRSLSSSECTLQLCTGLAAIFCNEKIIAARIGFKKYYFLTKHDSVEEFICSNVPSTKDKAEFLTPFFGNGLFLSTGKKWKERRKHMSLMFNDHILKKCVPIFHEQSKVMVDLLKMRNIETWVDIEEHISRCIMDIVYETFLGVKLESQKNSDSEFGKIMVRAVRAMMKRMLNPAYHLDLIFNVSEEGRQFKKDLHYLKSHCMQLFQRMEESTNLQEEGNGEREMKECNLFERMLYYRKVFPETTVEDTRDELLSFFFASHDTTTVTLTSALYLIALYPEVQKKIQEELDVIFGDDPNRPMTSEDLKEMSYLECVLKECQRIYPSVPINPKMILQDFDLCGHKVKKGNVVVLNVYSLHRDPEVFPNPEVFDPDRFLPENCIGRSPYAYIPFSAGARNCIGRGVAMLIQKTVAANLLRAFSWKARDQRDKVYMTSFQILLRPARPIKLQFTTRKTG